MGTHPGTGLAAARPSRAVELRFASRLDVEPVERTPYPRTTWMEERQPVD